MSGRRDGTRSDRLDRAATILVASWGLALVALAMLLVGGAVADSSQRGARDSVTRALGLSSGLRSPARYLAPTGRGEGETLRWRYSPGVPSPGRPGRAP